MNLQIADFVNLIGVLLFYLLAPPLQGAVDFGILAEVANLSSTGLLILGMAMLVRGDILTKGAIEGERVQAEVDRTRERTAAQAAYAAMLTAQNTYGEDLRRIYDLRLQDKDAQLAAKHLEIESWRQSNLELMRLLELATTIVQKNTTP